MNISARLKIVAGMIFLICSGCALFQTPIIGKECGFIEISEWGEKSQGFLRMPKDFKPEDNTYTDSDGIIYYRYAPDFLFEDMKPSFRNNRNAKKHCLE